MTQYIIEPKEAAEHEKYYDVSVNDGTNHFLSILFNLYILRPVKVKKFKICLSSPEMSPHSGETRAGFTFGLFQM
jgi:hypothetical protein